MGIKTCEMVARIGAILAVIALSGGAFAAGAAGDAYSFETGGTLGSGDLAGLSGNGSVADAVPSRPAVGYPLDSAAHAKVLEIAGTVTYTNHIATPGTTSSQVDFMFKVEPTDELDDPSGDDVQIVLAVGTNDIGEATAPIKLWSRATAGDEPDWQLLGYFATGSWVRATLVLDYDAALGRCSVSLDGNPALNGVSKWFYFANGANQTYVKSITMVGSTLIDDLVVTNTATAAEYVAPGSSATVEAASTGVNVTYEYMNKYGVTTNEVAQNATVGAGMTVADKFEAGLDPRSETRFALQTMNVSAATSATVTFPGNNASGNYDVIVTDSKDGSANAEGVEVSISDVEGAKTSAGEQVKKAEITIPAEAPALLYIKLKTK